MLLLGRKANSFHKRLIPLQSHRSISTNTVREKFIDFFIKNGYRHLPSASVVPRQDPSLLFTSAGMVPFKERILNPNNFRGEDSKIVTVQKCIRAGGKNCDLDNVGMSPRHLSFFEMCGFFQLPPASINFKRESIQQAMQFLTEDLGLDSQRLKVTVHESDKEAHEIWRRDFGKEAYMCNSKDNFWSMGSDKGLPCGPCSEIYYDFSPHLPSRFNPSAPLDCPPPDDPNCLEIWNLVFMQYSHNGKDNSNYEWIESDWEKLPGGACLDTGMGLERLTSVIQGAYNSNFMIDSLYTIISHARSILSSVVGYEIPYADFSDPVHCVPIVQESSISLRIIADHLRTVSIMISDGVTPSATGRGYVLRRILRRMVLHAHLLGVTKPYLENLLPSVLQTLGGAYPEVIERQAIICQLIQQEESLFHGTIQQGIKVLENYFDEHEGSISIGRQHSILRPSSSRPILPPELVFTLHDSMGFPMDLTCQYAKKKGYDIDIDAVNSLLDEQRDRSRKSWKGIGANLLHSEVLQTLGTTSEATFTGYQRLSERSKLLGYSVATTGNEKLIYLCIDPCPFYAEGGGQVGDSGKLLFSTGKMVSIKNCIKLNQTHVLVTSYQDETLALLDQYKHLSEPMKYIESHVDESLRISASRNHTATHLLNSALRKVLGESVVHQAGSYVGPDRLRFDFTCPFTLSKDQLSEVERIVREFIKLNAPVTTKVLPYQQAIQGGAISLDSCDQYSDVVRVIEVSNPNQESHFLSKELCGGTHVQVTGDIAPFIIINESSVAAGVRRIEGLTGIAAEQYIHDHIEKAKYVSNLLGTSVDQLVETTRNCLAKQKSLENQIFFLNEQLLLASLEAPLRCIFPGDSHNYPTQIHWIKSKSAEQSDKSKKSNEAKQLRCVAQKLAAKFPDSVHIVIKGRLAVCAISNQFPESLPKPHLHLLLNVLGGKPGGGGPGFTLGLFDQDISESHIETISNWANVKRIMNIE